MPTPFTKDYSTPQTVGWKNGDVQYYAECLAQTLLGAVKLENKAQLCCLCCSMLDVGSLGANVNV